MAGDKREYLREWRAKNPGKTQEYHRRYMLKYVRARVAAWDEYRKGLKCERCGFDDFRALEHHHRDPSQKSFSVGYAVRRMSWDRVLEEIAKCEVVCANCHRIEHYKNLPQTPRDENGDQMKLEAV